MGPVSNIGQGKIVADQKFKQKRFPASNGMRWLNIAVRTAHIAVGGVVFGGFMLQVPHHHLVTWLCLTIASGGVLLALEWMHDADWPHRGKGLFVYLHALLGLFLHAAPGLVIFLIWGIVISGSIGSHMPRRFRHWSFLHGPEPGEGE